MNASDQSILGVVAHGHTPLLDQQGFSPDWIDDKDIKSAVTAAISLSRQNKTVNLLNVMALAQNVKDWPPLIKVWNNGYGDVDPQIALRSARTRYLAGQTVPIAQELLRKAQNEPDSIESWLPTQTTRLVSVVRQSTDYDPRPSAHYAKDVPQITFTSRIPVINRILRGGYRNGLLFVVVTPTAHGKSTLARTLTVDGVAQSKKVAYINNENTENKALVGILRGLSNLTEEEIVKRQGNTDERHAILLSWLAYVEDRLRIYDHTWYNDDRIRRILKWEKPDLLIGDYLRDLPGMFADGRRHENPVGDMADFLLQAANEYGVTTYWGAQISGEAASKYMRYGSHEPILAYGTVKVQQAADIYAGMRRHPTIRDAALVNVWKDRIGNEQDTEHDLMFDSDSWVFKA